MYTFQTKNSSTEQYKSGAQLAAGVYHADVVGMNETTSRSGNPMVEVLVQVLDGQVQLKDYLTLSTEAAWKIEQFLASTGKKFGKGETITFEPQSCLGAHVVVETYNERGDKGGVFPRIRRFIQASMHKDFPRAGFVFGAEDLKLRGLDSDGCSTSLRPYGATPRQAAAPRASTPPQSKVPPAQGADALLPHEDEDDIPF